VIDAILADGSVAHTWLGVTTATVDSGLASRDDAGADTGDLQEAVDALAPGTKVALTVSAPEGDTRTVEVTLGTRPGTSTDTTAATCG